MFYNALIEAFLADESLFTDVKAIVDCPLKVDPAEIVKACREKEPAEIVELLAQPGSDLIFPELTIATEISYGRNHFLETFGSSKNSAAKLTRRKSYGPTTSRESVDSDVLNSRMGFEEFDSGNLLLNGTAASSSTALDKRTDEESSVLSATRTKERRKTFAASRTDAVLQELKLGGVLSEQTKYRVISQYHARLQRFGRRLIKIWAKFYRALSPSWAPDRNSLIAMPRPFVVPGGRFIEIYYWDSYWIILGLLASGLIDVARDVILNFLFCVERYGFIPNGMRKYYLDRSQPPMLSSMLRAFYQATGDKDFIAEAVPLLEREYEYWMSEFNGKVVRLQKIDEKSNQPVTYTLNRYYSLENTPRPESYRIDVSTGELLTKIKGPDASKEEHYRAIRSAAESGWDFSSRWLRPAIEGFGESGIRPDTKTDKTLHKTCLIDIDTCNVVPCDLNAFLFNMETDLAFFSDALQKSKSKAMYSEALENRRKAMMEFLWDSEMEIWLDYDMLNQKRSHVISAASFVPLWSGVLPETMSSERRIQLASNLSCIVKSYGVVCTNITAGLQWDSPNVWAPNHHIAVEFLAGGRFWHHTIKAADDHGPAMVLAANWASRFVNTVLDRFEIYNTCAEKYDCRRLGKSGLDGEYVTQDGFGWTNGTVLDLLEKFGILLTPQGLFSSKIPGDIFQ